MEIKLENMWLQMELMKTMQCTWEDKRQKMVINE